MDDLDFELEKVEETSAYPEKTIYPKGDYESIITKKAWGRARSGKGEYLRVDFLITEPNMPNEIVPTFLNLKHEDEKTKNIAKATLKKIVIAGGKDPEGFKDTEGLIDMRMILSLEPDGKYNRIKDFKSVSTGDVNLSSSKADKKVDSVSFSDDDIPF